MKGLMVLFCCTMLQEQCSEILHRKDLQQKERVMLFCFQIHNSKISLFSHGRLTRNTRERPLRIRLPNNVKDYQWSKARFRWLHTISKRSESQDLWVSEYIYTETEQGCNKRLHFYALEYRLEMRRTFQRVIPWPILPKEKATFTNIKSVCTMCCIHSSKTF